MMSLTFHRPSSASKAAQETRAAQTDVTHAADSLKKLLLLDADPPSPTHAAQLSSATLSEIDTCMTRLRTLKDRLTHHGEVLSRLAAAEYELSHAVPDLTSRLPDLDAMNSQTAAQLADVHSQRDSLLADIQSTRSQVAELDAAAFDADDDPLDDDFGHDVRLRRAHSAARSDSLVGDKHWDLGLGGGDEFVTQASTRPLAPMDSAAWASSPRLSDVELNSRLRPGEWDDSLDDDDDDGDDSGGDGDVAGEVRGTRKVGRTGGPAAFEACIS